MEPAIDIRNLTRTFGDHVAVDDVSLTLPWGRIHGYLGLNGAGKSTTIKVLTTLLAPSAGTARVAGFDVVADPLAVRACIGLVGDEGAESRPSWTAEEYVGYFARVRGGPAPAAEVARVLDVVGLEDAWRRRPIGAYSTGMKRRVEIARALLGAPRVLFLDEPTRGLDLPAKREIWSLLQRLVAGGDVTVFLSSHEVAEVHTLCEDITVLARGRVTFSGPASGLGKDPVAFERSLIERLRGSAEVARP